MRYLRQSTSADVPIGPFVDATDGVTAETALTITQPDVRLKKNAAAWAQKAAAQTLSHEENGFYEVTLDATDTDTLGLLRLAVFETGAAPVWEDFHVVPANVWDSMFSTDKLQVDVVEGSTVNAVGAHPTLGIIDSGTLQSATGTTAVIRAAASFADDRLNGMTIVITGGTGVGQARQITDYVTGTDTATVDTWTTNPDNTSTYVIFGTPPAVATGTLPSVTVGSGGITTASFAAGAINAAAIAADAITDAKVASDVTIASVTGAVGSVTGAVGSVTGAVGSVTGNVGGNVVGTVGTVNAIAANAITAAALATDAVTEIQSGLATASALTTVDTVVDAIQVKTDLLTFSDTNKVLADTRRINNTVVQGVGTSLNKWRG
jgi:hypothetical protein